MSNKKNIKTEEADRAGQAYLSEEGISDLRCENIESDVLSFYRGHILQIERRKMKTALRSCLKVCNKTSGTRVQ